MKKILLIFYLLYAGICVAQQSKQSFAIQPLKIGDKLPDLPMAKVLLNDKIISLNSKDYRDRLMILDFWDIWCGACIASFPKLDSLQKIYGNKLQIISTTYQKEGIIRDFKTKNKLAKAFKLPIMVEDSLFKTYFPYNSVPHVVWINKGEVIAISNNDYISGKVIDKVLNGEKINLPVKYDFYNYDYKNTSILGSAQQDKKMIYSVISGYKEGVQAKGRGWTTVLDSLNGMVRDVFLNNEIARLYIRLLAKVKPIYYMLKPSMIIVEAKNPEHYDRNYKKEEDFDDDWLIKNSISYESVLPGNLNEQQRAKLMLADLDNKLGLHGRMETRPGLALVIKPLAGIKPLTDEGIDGKSIGKQPYETFMISLKINTMTYLPPIIDESNAQGKIFDVYGYKDLASLKRMLNLNGFDIVEETRPIDVFVLTETRN